MNLNEAQLVRMAVIAKVANPIRYEAFEVDHEGKGHQVPSVGGIVYNVKVGDTAFGWRGDHIEPGVSMILDEKNRSGRENMAFTFLACVGNEVTITSGPAKGAKGVVTGLHGGVEHVMADFPQSVLEKMSGDEKFLIKAHGQGLRIEGCAEIFCYNADPLVLKKMGIKQLAGGRLEVPVTHQVPASIMGSGIGHPDPGTGDYDITTQDPKMVKKYRLDALKLGDIVAILDADNTYGRHYYEGAVTIAIVSHSDSFLSGHGPGVTTLLSSKTGKIKPVVKANANISRVLGIGRARKK